MHCALGAVTIGVSGLAASVSQDERVEALLLASAMGIAVVAVVRGYRRYRDRRVVLFVLAGLSLLGIGRCVEAFPLLHTASSVVASALLIGGHALNARSLHLLRACCDSNG
jgi:hypothetical protein